MKIITRPEPLKKEFLRLLDQYESYYWATAWASHKSEPFKKLLLNTDKIKQIVVGIHFYQTHPDFIEKLLNIKNVKFIIQPEGTFHPKVFVFYNSDSDWEMIIGSANFTNAAFTSNTEFTTLISSKDLNADITLKQTLSFIDKFWQKTSSFDKNELKNYKTIWRNLKPKRDSLSGNYAARKTKRKNTPIHQSTIVSMDWNTFFKNVEKGKYHSLDSRIGVLETCRNLFNDVDSFSDLEIEARKFVAGMPNDLNVVNHIDWGYFGSMQGAGIFKNRIIENDVRISKALDEIPLSGQITKAHYDRYIERYKKVFPGNYLSTATRLLAMKRPDVFVCLSSKNKRDLCKNFGIVQSGLDYERYWTDIILRIYDSEWWLNPKPKNAIERKVSDGRAAFLDALYYEE